MLFLFIRLPPELVFGDLLHPGYSRTSFLIDLSLLLDVCFQTSILLNTSGITWKKKLCQYPTQAKSVWEISNRVAEVWGEIEPEVCQKLIESMPRRIVLWPFFLIVLFYSSLILVIYSLGEVDIIPTSIPLISSFAPCLPFVSLTFLWT